MGINIIKAKNYDDLSKMAAIIIGARLMKKPHSVMGFATGSTPVGTYAELVRLYKESLLDFSRMTTFNLDEYYGVEPDDKNSYRHFMHEHLFDHVNVTKERINLMDGLAKNADAECERYEKLIAGEGGIDLQLLGIGHNGHIGFNEPGEDFAPATHHVKLAESTIDANARFYQTRDEVPKSALSMGIGSIMRARGVLMLISGKEKAAIAEKALYGPVTPQVPASILQYHKNCTVILAVE